MSSYFTSPFPYEVDLVSSCWVRKSKPRSANKIEQTMPEVLIKEITRFVQDCHDFNCSKKVKMIINSEDHMIFFNSRNSGKIRGFITTKIALHAGSNLRIMIVSDSKRNDEIELSCGFSHFKKTKQAFGDVLATFSGKSNPSLWIIKQNQTYNFPSPYLWKRIEKSNDADFAIEEGDYISMKVCGTKENRSIGPINLKHFQWNLNNRMIFKQQLLNVTKPLYFKIVISGQLERGRSFIIHILD